MGRRSARSADAPCARITSRCRWFFSSQPPRLIRGAPLATVSAKACAQTAAHVASEKRAWQIFSSSADSRQRSLAAIPTKLLICDEATSALDVTVQKQILELLADLRRQTSLAILFISHDLALVQEFCDRALVMHNGRIVEQGTPDAIIQQPQHPYTQALIDAAL